MGAGSKYGFRRSSASRSAHDPGGRRLTDHQDIDEIAGTKLRFPIIGDKQRQVAYLYDMLDHQDTTNVDQKGIAFTIRSVFVIDPKKTIRLILSYPASTGRNTAEVLRVVDSLQTGDKHRITTPINWVPGKPDRRCGH